MAGATKRNTKDLSYEAVDANLLGGKLVIPSTTETASGLQGVKVAGANAANVLGVSANDAITVANREALENGTDASSGWPFVNVGVPDAVLTVYNDVVVRVTYTAVAVPYGTRLAAAANGAVAAATSGQNIVGWCAEPGGTSADGGEFYARILV